MAELFGFAHYLPLGGLQMNFFRLYSIKNNQNFNLNEKQPPFSEYGKRRAQDADGGA
ncbi:MAG: hypothetical protein J5833_01705 [Victivallales bacterium]|nr:hypothetical protein [Victivallales bacterium]